jgi:hypothetical protein
MILVWDSIVTKDGAAGILKVLPGFLFNFFLYVSDFGFPRPKESKNSLLNK